jgi:hypothetical protein
MRKVPKALASGAAALSILLISAGTASAAALHGASAADGDLGGPLGGLLQGILGPEGLLGNLLPGLLG